MTSKVSAALCLTVVLLGFLLTPEAEGRYLPTRGRMDRLDKLKELLKELLENEIEREEYSSGGAPRWHPEEKLFYKREASGDDGVRKE